MTESAALEGGKGEVGGGGGVREGYDFEKQHTHVFSTDFTLWHTELYGAICCRQDDLTPPLKKKERKKKEELFVKDTSPWQNIVLVDLAHESISFAFKGRFGRWKGK